MTDAQRRRNASKKLKMIGVYRTQIDGVIDPITQVVTPPTIVDTPIRAYIGQPSNGDITSNLASAGDALIYVSAEDLEGIDIKSGHEIILDKSYSVKLDKTVYGNTSKVLHQIICENR